MYIFSWAALISTVQAFACLPLIWGHIDTHLRNVRGTASLVLRNAPPEIISKNYADTVASLQLFCDLYSPVMLGVFGIRIRRADEHTHCRSWYHDGQAQREYVTPITKSSALV